MKPKSTTCVHLAKHLHRRLKAKPLGTVSYHVNEAVRRYLTTKVEVPR